jgi:uncharacterized protein
VTARIPIESAPFRSFILKVASRCNLNCSYCFVYNLDDKQYLKQPPFMSEATVRAFARRVREHCEANGVDLVHINFHGGEPTLLGAAKIKQYTDIIIGEIGPTAEVKFGMQSNGTKLTRSLLDVCRSVRLPIGISLDGPPQNQDKHRRDHMKRGSSEALEAGLAMLSSDEYRSIFGGLLVVMDLETEPETLYKYIKRWNPPGFDVILPYDNYIRWPARKQSASSIEYGEWLARLFDIWYSDSTPVPMREFESIIRLMFGSTSFVESIGTGIVDLIVVESDGSIEAVDSLKATFDGATHLGLNVLKHSFDDAMILPAVLARHSADQLCDACRSCRIVHVCGGGYLPNRYAARNGFDNPSVFCADLMHLIDHIERCVRRSLDRLKLRQS